MPQRTFDGDEDGFFRSVSSHTSYFSMTISVDTRGSQLLLASRADHRELVIGSLESPRHILHLGTTAAWPSGVQAHRDALLHLQLRVRQLQLL